MEPRKPVTTELAEPSRDANLLRGKRYGGQEAMADEDGGQGSGAVTIMTIGLPKPVTIMLPTRVVRWREP